GRLREGDADDLAPTDPPAEPGDDVEELHLETVFSAQGRVGAVGLFAVLRDDRGLRLEPRPAHLPPDVAVGDAGPRITADTLHLVRGAIGEHDERALELGEPDRRL